MIPIVRTLLLFAFALGLAAHASAADPPDPTTHLFDTSVASPAPLAPAAFGARATWREIHEADPSVALAGDAVFLNDRIAVVVRKDGPGAELYSLGAAGAVLRATLVPSGPAGPVPVRSVTPVSVAQDEVVVDCTAPGAPGAPAGVRLTISVGQVFVRATALGETTAVRLLAPTMYVALPDFFADDMVIGKDELPGGTAELPSENFLLQLCGDGDAIVMSVWQDRGQDVRVTRAETGSAPIDSTEISFGKDGSVWVALLASPGIWHARNISIRDRNKVLPLEWQRPFPAVWRVDWRRDDSLTDSWEMAVENPDGSYRKSDLFEASRDDWTDEDWWSSEKPRYRWNTGGFGGYMYPCWFDKNGKAFLQPLKKTITFDGPAVIYPINRSADTPLDAFTVTDIVRATLGMGPCQFILDIEGQGLAFSGKPTCATRDFLNPIYTDGEQTQRKDEVNKALDDVLAFMHLIRGRIEQYVAFAGEMDAFLTAQRAQHPESAAFLDETIALNHRITEAVERHREGMRPAGDADALVGEFRSTLIGYEGADAADKCEALTKQFVGIGDNQDELVAECRLAVKVLRQRAALMGVSDPRTAPIVAQVREKTQSILRDPVNYEAARH